MRDIYPIQELIQEQKPLSCMAVKDNSGPADGALSLMGRGSDNGGQALAHLMHRCFRFRKWI